jgi:hypothetical protein
MFKSTKKGREALMTVFGIPPKHLETIMKAKGRRTKAVTKPTDDSLFYRKTINNLELELVRLKRYCLEKEREHNILRDKLVALLLPEQIEAARICGCAPEIYALEWIDICKKKVQETTPAFLGNALSLRELR